MNEYKIKHHKLIRSVLNNFNADFFFANSIYFGGGTRIALEIDEYRESIVTVHRDGVDSTNSSGNG